MTTLCDICKTERDEEVDGFSAMKFIVELPTGGTAVVTIKLAGIELCIPCFKAQLDGADFKEAAECKSCIKKELKRRGQ